MELSLAARVRCIFLDCLFKEDEITEGKPNGDFIEVQGIVGRYGLHPKRTESHKEEIRELLNEMPSDFHADKGGGMSFLQLCMDKNGDQWAEHPTMEQLVVLGIASGLAKYCMPKEMWHILPGGVPYIQFQT